MSKVHSCPQCRIVDPAPVRWDHGSVEVEEIWSRVACDITHLNGQCYLTIIDCGPSRYAIWRKVSGEDSNSIVQVLLQVFREHGPPAELLMDNGASFRSQKVKDLCDGWAVRQLFRCAYRPSRNAIVERNHRTIKRMAIRAKADPLDMVYWYNISPRDGTEAESVAVSRDAKDDNGGALFGNKTK